MSVEKIVFLTFLVSCMSLTCPSYVCAPMATAGDCIEYTASNTTYLVGTCTVGSNTYCPPIIAGSAATTSKCTTPGSTYLSYPGESCTINADCQSNSCQKDYCMGAVAGAACTNPVGYTLSVMCNAGLYCNQAVAPAVCTGLVADGGTCTSDYECTYGTGCYGGTCVKYRSIANAKEVLNTYCSGYVSKYCSTGQCYTYTANNTSVCTSVFVGQTSFPIACTTDVTCNSKVNTMIGGAALGTCACSTGPSGKSYCPGYAGDGYGPKYASIVAKWEESSSIKNCNIDRIYTSACMESRWSKSDAAEYMYYSYMYMNQAAMQDIETCVSQVYYSGYAAVKSYYDKYYDSSALIISAVFAVFAL